MPSVATPEPAFTSRRIGVAVIAALELDDVCRGLVKARASRSADIVASVPELTKRTISMRGNARHDQLGQIDFAPVRGAEARAALHGACSRASTTAGMAWPRIIGPQEPM